MRTRRAGRIAFGVGFVVLLVDGALAIWLGQVTASTLMVLAGIALIGAAAVLSVVYRKWRRALDEVDAARAAAKAELGQLRAALDEARGNRFPGG